VTVLTELEGTVNFRDVGGLPTTGEPTAYGVLYRSDALHTLTPTGEAELAGSDIGVIVDFRTSAERDLAPDRRPDARAIRDEHLPLLEGPITPALAELIGGSPPAAIESALSWVDSTHGGSAGYLRSGGLTNAELTALQARLAG
jgi:protein-tyrosine phosphatase